MLDIYLPPDTVAFRVLNQKEIAFFVPEVQIIGIVGAVSILRLADQSPFIPVRGISGGIQHEAFGIDFTAVASVKDVNPVDQCSLGIADPQGQMTGLRAFPGPAKVPADSVIQLFFTVIVVGIGMQDIVLIK